MIELKIGDVLSTKNPVKYNFKTIFGWIFKLGVFEYQREMFVKKAEDRETFWLTHSRIYLGNDEWLSVTSPKAKIEKIDLSAFNFPFLVSRYVHSETFGATQHKEIVDFAKKKLNGTRYDYLQIATMALSKLFPNICGNERFLTASGDKVVCSVGALACLIAAWKTTDRTYERPGGDPINGDGVFLEAFPPAGFHNHKTFKTIWKYKW